MITMLPRDQLLREILSNKLHLLHWTKILQMFYQRLTFQGSSLMLNLCSLYRFSFTFLSRRLYRMKLLLHILFQMKFFHLLLNLSSIVQLPRLLFRMRSLEYTCFHQNLRNLLGILLDMSSHLHRLVIELIHSAS